PAPGMHGPRKRQAAAPDAMLTRREQGAGWLTNGPVVAHYQFYIFPIFSKLLCIDSIQRLPSLAQNFPNKICTCRELNKEQIFLLEFFKIRNGI
ncbi:hypothetical protein, partial [Sulfurimonas sp.]|uniref:hypothetical protein n=1 Tax=Sulfurimonas sp. TaxID=2022749 RepID=UPI003D0C64D4